MDASSLVGNTFLIVLIGGVGNNFYQMALGEYLKGNGAIVRYHLGLTKRNSLTEFLGWSIHGSELRNLVLEGEDVTEKWDPVLLGILIWMFLVKLVTRSSMMEFDKEKLKASRWGERVLLGYWQYGIHLNGQVYEKLRERILKIDGYKIARYRLVAHCRRGDFQPFERITNDYYFASFSRTKSYGRAIWLSDEPWVAKEFNRIEKFLVECPNNPSVISDFLTIFFADVVICSNSTFCYWAAVLGEASSLFVPARLNVDKMWDRSVFGKKVIVMNCLFESEVLVGENLL